MTDRTTMVEDIQRAMQALDEAHTVSERLRSEPNHETLDAFRQKMEKLGDELQMLKNIFGNQTLYAADELVDIFSQFFSGKPSAFRRMERFEPAEKSKKG